MTKIITEAKGIIVEQRMLAIDAAYYSEGPYNHDAEEVLERVRCERTRKNREKLLELMNKLPNEQKEDVAELATGKVYAWSSPAEWAKLIIKTTKADWRKVDLLKKIRTEKKRIERSKQKIEMFEAQNRA